MDLLEYQAKKLFQEVGIPVLPSQTIKDPRALKQLQIPYPVVLKSQVRVGGRGRAGGIRFVENTIDAIAAARAIFNLAIFGEYPQVLLAEARYNSELEFFLAVVLDYELQRPVLLGSATGGMNVENLLKNLQKVVVDEDFSLFYARRLATKMGVKGQLIKSISQTIEKMYHLFLSKDLDLIEINPLGVSATGEVMALDGKITVNDLALNRHPDLMLLTDLKLDKLLSNTEFKSQEYSSILNEVKKLTWLEEKGKIGVICNSFNLALTTWDLIYQEKGKPACLFVIGEEDNNQPLTASSIVRQLEIALEEIIELKGVKVILVNIVASAKTSEIIANTIADFFLPSAKPESMPTSEERELISTGTLLRSHRPNNAIDNNKQKYFDRLQLIVRLVTGEIGAIQENLASLPITWSKNLDEAIAMAISLAKSK